MNGGLEADAIKGGSHPTRRSALRVSLRTGKISAGQSYQEAEPLYHVLLDELFLRFLDTAVRSQDEVCRRGYFFFLMRVSKPRSVSMISLCCREKNRFHSHWASIWSFPFHCTSRGEIFLAYECQSARSSCRV